MKAYSAIPSSDDNNVEEAPDERAVPQNQNTLKYLFAILSAILMLAGGFLLGFWYGSQKTGSTTTIGTRLTSVSHCPFADLTQGIPGELHYYMSFNGSFPQRSNEMSNMMWDSLFPKKLGFVQHPELAPNIAGIAVFHELHCLVSL
jgi:hypothetical protein